MTTRGRRGTRPGPGEDSYRTWPTVETAEDGSRHLVRWVEKWDPETRQWRDFGVDPFTGRDAAPMTSTRAYRAWLSRGPMEE